MVICVLGGCRVIYDCEAWFPVLDTVFKRCTPPPPLSVVIGCVCVHASWRGSCELCSILCTAIHPISFLRHRTSIYSLTALPNYFICYLFVLFRHAHHVNTAGYGHGIPATLIRHFPTASVKQNPNPTHPTTTTTLIIMNPTPNPTSHSTRPAYACLCGWRERRAHGQYLTLPRRTGTLSRGDSVRVECQREVQASADMEAQTEVDVRTRLVYVRYNKPYQHHQKYNSIFSTSLHASSSIVGVDLYGGYQRK